MSDDKQDNSLDQIDKPFDTLSKVCPSCWGLIMRMDSDLDYWQQVQNFALTHTSHLCALLKE